MKIKKLELSGFKSFVDRTVLHFDHEVTCIVGPNGCGKSNVVDAIRWAMGEQSAKTLRGRGMDDVLFNGSESRGPCGLAEVTLTFDNTDRLASPEYNDYAEIAVTRRLDREGHSEYLINKTPVRLMDVTNLFLGTGVGRKSSYSIVEQGRIGLIVSARPQDRRTLIEEAAGITKFKAQKLAAERKMEQTQQNLLRVGDIVSELQTSLASLKRQAQKAERYKRYRAEIRELDLWVASHRYLELTAQHRVTSARLAQADTGVSGARSELRAREEELQGERSVVQGLEAELSDAQGRSYEADNRVRLLASELEHRHQRSKELRQRELAARKELATLHAQRAELRGEADAIAERLSGLRDSEASAAERLKGETQELERRRAAALEAERGVTTARERIADADKRIARADATLAGIAQRQKDQRARLQRIESERREIEERVVELRAQGAELSARLEGLRSDKASIGMQRGELEQELVRLRAEIVQSDERVEQLRSKLAEKRSRLRSLEEIQQRFEGVGAGVRAVMTGFRGQNGREHGRVHGLVADRFECPPELTRALAAALGEKLQYVVVDDLATGVEAVRFLSEGKRGRATLIPSVPTGVHVARPGPAPAEPHVIGRLLDLVTVQAEDQVLAEYLLSDVLVVEHLDGARELHEAGQTTHLLVTREGHVLSPEGALSGGDGEDAGAHLIAVKREVRELRDEVARFTTEMDAARSHHSSLRNAIAQRQAALESTRSDAHEREIGVVKAERDLKRAEEGVAEGERRLGAVSQEATALLAQLEGGGDAEREARAEREVAEQLKGEGTAELAQNDETHRMRRALVEEQGSVVTEVRVRAAEAKQRVEGDVATAERLKRSLTDLAAREVRLTQDLGTCAASRGEIAGAMAREQEEHDARSREARALSDAVLLLKVRYDEARGRLSDEEQVLRTMRLRIESESQLVNELGMQEREALIAIEHLIEGVNERHRVDVRFQLIDFHDREPAGDVVHARIDELRKIVERMGEINLTAIEEYEERAQRYEYLAAQKLDLETAIEQLEKAIRQMNRKSQTMFRDAFEEVNARFKQLFPRMFGGGRAELRLTDSENMLEAGIDIVAQPPGKKLTSIELMSGGEKALTAVSLIFALFRYRPSPFCLLDEVDAPLDEANVGRYCEMIREMTDRSQFILITHSKTTMESGDVLYGVTMESPGVSKLVSVELRKQERGLNLDDSLGSAAAVA